MKPLAAKQPDKVTPENKAVFARYGDQCGHPWPPVFYLTHHLFSISNPTSKCKIGCTASPQSFYTFIFTITERDFIHTQMVICQIMRETHSGLSSLFKSHWECCFTKKQMRNYIYLRPGCTGFILSLCQSFCSGTSTPLPDVSNSTANMSIMCLPTSRR